MSPSYRDTHLPSARPGRGEVLRGAACATLPPEVADRYMRADYRAAPFAHLTGRMVCHGCPVREACLADAIADGTLSRSSTPVAGLRGGEPAWRVAELTHRHRHDRVPAATLAREALAVQLAPFRGAYGRAELRAGGMPDHLPAWD